MGWVVGCGGSAAMGSGLWCSSVWVWLSEWVGSVARARMLGRKERHAAGRSAGRQAGLAWALGTWRSSPPRSCSPPTHPTHALFEQRVGHGLPQQHAVGGKLDDGARAAALFKADAVAHLLSQRDVHLLGHAPCHAHGRHSPGLRAHHLFAALAVPRLQGGRPGGWVRGGGQGSGPGTCVRRAALRRTALF